MMASKNRTHVPDKLEAFMLQVRHALYELICTPEESNVISVEAFDDVAVEGNVGITAEQIKSAVSSENPLANRSVSFWKAIYNWCDYLLTENLNPNKLKLIVVAAGKFTPGSIPDAFNKAHSRTEADVALKLAADVLKSTSKGEKLASDECLPYLNYCFAEKNKEIILQVIELFSYSLHNGTYDETLKRRFYEQLIPPEYADTLLITMLGWVSERIHSFTRENRPAFITKKKYNDALRKELRGLNQSTILRAVSTAPNDVETNSEVIRHDTYIRQLEIIDIEAGGLFAAASDFLMASAEKTEWAKRGLVTDHSFDDYNDAIKRSWSANRREVNVLYSKTHSEEQQGQLLYSKCQSTALTVSLQGCCVPSFFGNGVLHSLANEPAGSPQIGWHPNYRDILTEGKDNERDK